MAISRDEGRPGDDARRAMAPTRGRGAASRVAGRFEKREYRGEDDGWGSVYDGMDRSFAGIEHYHDAGFFISGMFPINVEKSLAVIEYDCVLVKRDV